MGQCIPVKRDARGHRPGRCLVVTDYHVGCQEGVDSDVSRSNMRLRGTMDRLEVLDEALQVPAEMPVARI
eukprot:13479579-Heterocapsa_arctica.AAC.1